MDASNLGRCGVADAQAPQGAKEAKTRHQWYFAGSAQIPPRVRTPRIGLVVNTTTWAKHLRDVYPRSGHILEALVAATPCDVTLMVAYALPANRPVEEKDAVYELVASILLARRKGPVSITGDFNMRLCATKTTGASPDRHMAL